MCARCPGEIGKEKKEKKKKCGWKKMEKMRKNEMKCGEWKMFVGGVEPRME